MSVSRPGMAQQAPAPAAVPEHTADPVPAADPEQELLRVHVANGHMTSGGPGQGEVVVPRSEARALGDRHCRIIGPAGQQGDVAALRTRRGVSN